MLKKFSFLLISAFAFIVCLAGTSVDPAEETNIHRSSPSYRDSWEGRIPTPTPEFVGPRIPYVPPSIVVHGVEGGGWGSVRLSPIQVGEVLAEAGWPKQEWNRVAIIGFCESKYSPLAVGDSGRSLGWLQLNVGHFPKAASAGYIDRDEVQLWWDPLVNAKVARWLWTARGYKYAGGGGWSCAGARGIYP